MLKYWDADRYGAHSLPPHILHSSTLLISISHSLGAVYWKSGLVSVSDKCMRHQQYYYRTISGYTPHRITSHTQHTHSTSHHITHTAHTLSGLPSSYGEDRHSGLLPCEGCATRSDAPNQLGEGDGQFIGCGDIVRCDVVWCDASLSLSPAQLTQSRSSPDCPTHAHTHTYTHIQTQMQILNPLWLFLSSSPA